MENEILEEVWRNRDAIAKRYDYDLDKIVAMIQEREKSPLNVMATPAQRRMPLEK